MFAIGRPGKRGHNAYMTDICQQCVARGSIPELHCGIQASRGEVFPVRGPGYCRDPIGVALVRQHSVPRDTPDLNRLVIAGRSQVASIRGPGDGGHCVRVATIGQEALARCGLPDLDRLVKTGRSQILPIGGPCYCTNPIAVSSIDSEAMSCYGIPDLNCLIIAGRSNPLAVGGPRRRGDSIKMTMVCVEGGFFYRRGASRRSTPGDGGSMRSRTGSE